MQHPSVAPRHETPSPGDWRDSYAWGLRVTDLLVLVWVVFGVQIAWFGFTVSDVQFRGELYAVAVNYTAISVILIAAWMVILGIYGSRGYRVIGTGSQEYRAIAGATVRLFGLVALAAYLFQIDLARGYILIAFPMGLVVLVFSRWIWRQWLSVKRLNGQYSSRVVLIGSPSSVALLHRELARQSEAGYLVVGACIPSGFAGDVLPGSAVPVFGSVTLLQQFMAENRADTVIVTSNAEMSPHDMRELSWSLEPGRQHLVVAPNLTGIGGPRIHTRPVNGLPLIHVETPRYEGGKLFAKRGFDVVASFLLIVLLSVPLAVIALIVRFSTPGPVVFRQKRVGLNGKQFTMLKFRSMVTDAESQLATLQAQKRSAGNAVLFKMENDPRITPAGRVLRRFSLDELPQLFNVLGGSMSLVGPRPSLEREVSEYETHVHRRFLVKPGITGPWQVGGRSNLSWEDTVRLDLYYVENWSIMGDIVILWRTASAVMARDGAF
ncbi:polyprenyl glycosylphosphotransferase [Cryobacterium roopkundense]|uniref:Polyprenyl glycosylphosphotransferase n=1 Tax=Cryobacterium roopkundense TaxID=1001240 RepID=A0A099JUC7_9MICO|nr:polyprenyl glycosylphosphotransferase [Cryobacterium roopkundense]